MRENQSHGKEFAERSKRRFYGGCKTSKGQHPDRELAARNRAVGEM